jgi:apolipoprotein D and lipocalin family protein
MKTARAGARRTGMRYLTLLALALALAACSTSYRAAQPPLESVAAVDLDRYAGLWHEQARLPNWFERGCVAATAEYARRPDGLIGVRNVCTREDGATSDVDGRAKIVDAASNARLKVSFFGPFFFGDYWVIDLDADYRWVIVGEPRGRYLWVLTRAPEIDAATRAALTARVAALGYRTDALVWNAGASGAGARPGPDGPPASRDRP